MLTEIRIVARAICKSRTCEGINCCQWPAQMGRRDCPVERGAYDDAAQAAVLALKEPAQRKPMSEIPHPPWFIRPKPRPDGQAIIENGTVEGSLIAVCEWHIAEHIIQAVNAELSHDDLCRLSRLFNVNGRLDRPQDARINEWLKAKIAIADAIKHNM